MLQFFRKIGQTQEKSLSYSKKSAIFQGKNAFRPYDRRLHPLELVLFFAILFSSVVGAWLSREQADLADGMIRLHVVANSDLGDDQELKYVVRDAVLELAESLYQEGLSPTEAEALFSQELDAFAQAGQAVAGDYQVEVELAPQWFPTKVYEHFSLPAGEYQALQVKIGEAKGENWWCVAYPPLCLGAASQSVEEAVEAGNFSQNQATLVTGEGYILKFKSLELLGQAKGLWEQIKPW